jgi:DMSO reductase anchor subunit
MKLNRSYPPQRRRNPLLIPAVLLGLMVIGFLAYCWHLGGPQPIRAVEMPVAAERLGR